MVLPELEERMMVLPELEERKKQAGEARQLLQTTPRAR